MSSTMPMRVDGDLFDAAKSVGAVASRSAAQKNAAKRWPEAQAEHAYEASRAAAGVRAQLLADGKSFVISHPSKVDLV